MNLLQELGRKGVDTAKVATEAIDNPRLIKDLVQGLVSSKGATRYGFEKVLRLVSEQRPELLYAYFDVFVDLLDDKNSFLKWGAILTIANLASIDADDRFEKIFDMYYAPLTGPVMVTSVNIIGSSAKIALAKPELTARITREILKVENAHFEMHDKPSPECRNVAIGQAIDAFDQVFDQIEDKGTIVEFVKRQLRNKRKPVAQKAARFLKRHEK